MNNLTVLYHNNVEVIDSREVALMVKKSHNDLMKSIRNYCSYLGEGDFSQPDFFIESSYINRGKTYPCYLLTKKGCDMVANKMTGEKGVLFTAAYVTAFEKMKEQIQSNISLANPDKTKKLEIQEMNARVRVSNQLLKLANVDTLSAEYKNILVSKASEVLTGTPLIPLPKSVQKTYTATELGQRFGVSAQKIGSLSNKYHLKTEEYGEWYRSKSQYSNKEVDTFMYYDSVIPVLESILGIVQTA